MSELFIFSRISGCLCTVSAADWDGWYRNRPYCPVKKEPGSYVKQSRQAHTSAYSVMLISAFLFWMLTEKSCGFFVCILTGMVRSTDGVRLKPLNKKKIKIKKTCTWCKSALLDICISCCFMSHWMQNPYNIIIKVAPP